MRCAWLATLALLAAACADAEAPQDGAEHSEHAGAHVHEAPHGGTLVPCGEEFANVELVLDAAAGTLTAFTLGPHAAQHVRLPDTALRVECRLGDETVELALAAVTSDLTGETVGDTSEFAVTDPRLVGLERLAGTLLELSIRGRTFPALPFELDR